MAVHTVSHPHNGTQPTRLAAIYARVSTADQADKGYSLPTQIEACQAMAAREGYAVPENLVFVDDYTGTSLNRPQFTRLRDLIRHTLVAAVFIYDLDRLSRKLAHQMLLSDEADAAGVSFRFVTMPDGARTPEAHLLTNMRGIIAEYEREKTLERTARGRTGRAKEGHVPYGRRTLGYLYVAHTGRSDACDQDSQRCVHCNKPWGKGACYVVHPEEAALVQRIFRLCTEDGLSVYKIAKLLTHEGSQTPLRRLGLAGAGSVWHPTTVASVLHNQTYIGVVYDNKTTRLAGKSNPDKKTRHRRMPQDAWIAVEVPQIIDQETFEAAQRQLVRNQKRSTRNRKHPYLLVSGRLRCGQCGQAMSGVTKAETYRYYGCHRRPFFDPPSQHTKRTVRAAGLEEFVWKAMARALDNPALIVAEIERQRHGTSTHQADLERERQQYARQLTQCEQALERWAAAYEALVIDLADYKAKKAEIETRRASAEHELARLHDQQQLIEEAELKRGALEELCARWRAGLQHATLDKKQQALEAFDITVTWHPAWPTPKITGNLSPELFSIMSNSSRCTVRNMPFTLAAAVVD